MLCLLETSRNLQMSAGVSRHIEEPSLQTLLTLNVENPLISLVGTRRPTESTIEQQTILFLKTLIRNKASIFCRLEQSVLKCK
jgi:hypothetical protein